MGRRAGAGAGAGTSLRMKSGRGSWPRPLAVGERPKYGFFAGAFDDESAFVVVVVVVVVFVFVESIFMPVSVAAAAVAAADAAAAGVSSFFSPEQAVSTSAAATNAIFFMAGSPYGNRIGTIETAPYTQSSDSDESYGSWGCGSRPNQAAGRLGSPHAHPGRPGPPVYAGIPLRESQPVPRADVPSRPAHHPPQARGSEGKRAVRASHLG